MSNIKVDNLVNSSGKVVSVDDVAKAVSTNTHINDDSTGADKLSLQKTKDVVNNFPSNVSPLALIQAMALCF